MLGVAVVFAAVDFAVARKNIQRERERRKNVNAFAEKGFCCKPKFALLSNQFPFRMCVDDVCRMSPNIMGSNTN